MQQFFTLAKEWLGTLTKFLDDGEYNEMLWHNRMRRRGIGPYAKH